MKIDGRARPAAKGDRRIAIIGTHMLLYSSEAEKLRAVLRDVFGSNH